MFAHTDKKWGDNPGWGAWDCQDSGSGTVLVGTEDNGLFDGHPMGPTETPITRCRKKGYILELLRREMLNHHPPARPFRRQRWVVCNMPWDKGGSFSVYFPPHLCCLSMIGQSFIAEAAPAPGLVDGNAIYPLCGMENKVIRCSSAQVFFTVKDSNVSLRGWERCSSLPPWNLLGAPPGAPPSPPPQHCLQPQAGISSAPGRAG